MTNYVAVRCSTGDPVNPVTVKIYEAAEAHEPSDEQKLFIDSDVGFLTLRATVPGMPGLVTVSIKMINVISWCIFSADIPEDTANSPLFQGKKQKLAKIASEIL